MRNYYHIATSSDVAACINGTMETIYIKGKRPEAGDTIWIKEALIRKANEFNNYEALYAFDEDIAGPWYCHKWKYGVVHPIHCPGSHIRFRFKVTGVHHPLGDEIATVCDVVPV